MYNSVHVCTKNHNSIQLDSMFKNDISKKEQGLMTE